MAPVTGAMTGPARRGEQVVDLFLLGSVAYQQGRPEPAVLMLEQAVRLRPDHLWARHLLALSYLRLGESARAEAHLSVCLEQKLKRAAEELKKAIECASEPGRVSAGRYRSHEALAEVYRQRERLPEARAEIEKAISLQRDQPDLYRRHARVQLDRGRVREAV